MLLMSPVSASSTSTLQRSSRRWSMERAMIVCVLNAFVYDDY